MCIVTEVCLQEEVSNKFKNEVIDIVKKKYYDFGLKFASEKLLENESKKVSKETLRKWVIEEGICIPRDLRKKTDVHPWRRCKDCFGEMLLADGSIHDWLEGRGPKMVLLAYIYVLPAMHLPDSTLLILHMQQYTVLDFI